MKSSSQSAPLPAYLDTSVIIESIYGITDSREPIEQELRRRPVTSTSGYVWVEYNRGLVWELIDFYFHLKSDELDVKDAITYWFNYMDKRKLTYIGINLFEMFGGMTNPISKPIALKKWREEILYALKMFELRAKTFVENKTSCGYIKRGINPSLLRDVSTAEKEYIRFWRAYKEDYYSDCKMCQKLKSKGLDAEKILNHTATLSSGRRDGFIAIQTKLNSLISGSESLTCTRCSRVGDMIIVADCPKNHEIFSTDDAFIELSAATGKKLKSFSPSRRIKPRAQILKELIEKEDS